MTDFRKSIAGCVGALCEAFGRTPSEATFDAYEWGLEGLSAEEIREATRLALRQCKFMPAPSELRELVAAGESPASRSWKAWSAFERGVAQHGYRDILDFDDSLINGAARAVGGLERYWVLPEGEQHWFRRDFLQAYEQLVKHPSTADMCRPLVGPLEAYYGRERETILITTGLPIGPLQRRLASERTDKRPSDVPRVEFRKVT